MESRVRREARNHSAQRPRNASPPPDAARCCAARPSRPSSAPAGPPPAVGDLVLAEACVCTARAPLQTATRASGAGRSNEHTLPLSTNARVEHLVLKPGAHRRRTVRCRSSIPASRAVARCGATTTRLTRPPAPAARRRRHHARAPDPHCCPSAYSLFCALFPTPATANRRWCRLWWRLARARARAAAPPHDTRAPTGASAFNTRRALAARAP